MKHRLQFPSRLLDAAAVVAVIFGAMTILSGARALFAGANAGAFVPFVLWFNFLAGFVYIVAGVGLWRRTRWASALAIGLALATLAVFGAFGVHIAGGGAFETRTAWAMALRSALWVALAAAACWTLGCVGVTARTIRR